jgi:hypothetical protein
MDVKIEPDRHTGHSEYQGICQQGPLPNAMVRSFVSSRRIGSINSIVEVVVESIASCDTQKDCDDDQKKLEVKLGVGEHGSLEITVEGRG